MPSFYKAPDAILEELGVREPADLKIEAIAEYCGATIIYAPLEGTEARILGYGDRAIITVNSAAPRGRQRFSGGHELGLRVNGQTIIPNAVLTNTRQSSCCRRGCFQRTRRIVR